MEVLKQYLDGGGNVLVMLGEGGRMKYDTNINFLLEEFGIMVNNGAYLLCEIDYPNIHLQILILLYSTFPIISCDDYILYMCFALILYEFCRCSSEECILQVLPPERSTSVQWCSEQVSGNVAFLNLNEVVYILILINTCDQRLGYFLTSL